MGLNAEETNMLLKELKQRPQVDISDVFEDAGLFPGVQVWVMDGMAPRAIPEEEHGTLYSGDAYIILHTLETDFGTDYTLYQWAGDQAGMDRTGSVAVWTVQLAGHLGEIGSRCRMVQETDGLESIDFLAMFGGVMHVEGSCAVRRGLKKVEARPPRLFHIVQSNGEVHVMSRRPHWTSIPCVTMPRRLTYHDDGTPKRYVDHGLPWSQKEHGDCITKYAGLFVLQHQAGIFTFHPPTPPSRPARHKEKARMLETLVALQNETPGARHFIVGSDTESDAAFWDLVGGRPTWERIEGFIASRPAPEADEDFTDDDEEEYMDPEPRLYRVSFATGSLGMVKQAPVKGDKFSRDTLTDDAVFILLAPADLFVWTGNRATQLEISGALHAAKTVIGPDNDVPVERVIPTIEPVTFTAYFHMWNRVLHPSDYRVVTNTIAPALPDKPIDVTMMHTPPAPPVHPTTPPEGRMRCYRISDNKVTTLARDKYGHFYSRDVIVVCVDNTHRTGPKEDRAFHVYVWLGQDASPLPLLTYKQVLMTAFSRQVESSGGGRPVHHWERQGSESVAFNHLFASAMVIHTGGMSRLYLPPPPRTPAGDGMKLYQVGGWPYSPPRAVQVPLSFASLNSRDCFIAVIPPNAPGRPLACMDHDGKYVIILWRGRSAADGLADAAFDLTAMFIPIDGDQDEDDVATVIAEREGCEGEITAEALGSVVPILDETLAYSSLYPSLDNKAVATLTRPLKEATVGLTKARGDGGFDHLIVDDLLAADRRPDLADDLAQKSYPTLSQRAGDPFIPRLFRLGSTTGRFAYQRVIPMQQGALDRGLLFLVDTHAAVFIWGSAQHRDYARAVELAQRYVDVGAVRDGRCGCEVVAIAPDDEPPAFKCCFPGWHDRPEHVPVDPFAERSARYVQWGIEARMARLARKKELDDARKAADDAAADRIVAEMRTTGQMM